MSDHNNDKEQLENVKENQDEVHAEEGVVETNSGSIGQPTLPGGNG